MSGRGLRRLLGRVGMIVGLVLMAGGIARRHRTACGSAGGRRWAFWQRVDAPDVNDPARLFMTRWRLVQTPWFGIYVHSLNMADRRSTLHCHPWPFLSLILRGGYTEDIAVRSKGDRTGPVIGRRSRTWRAGSLHRMRRTDAHTITDLLRTPTWTLMLVGRRWPDPSWGYWDQHGWTPHDEHHHAAEFDAAQAARRTETPR